MWAKGGESPPHTPHPPPRPGAWSKCPQLSQTAAKLPPVSSEASLEDDSHRSATCPGAGHEELASDATLQNVNLPVSAPSAPGRVVRE